MNPKLTCSQCQWFHSSVGRASHRYRKVTGSSPVEVLNFFQASLRNCKNCDHNCEDHSSFDFQFYLLTQRYIAPFVTQVFDYMMSKYCFCEVHVWQTQVYASVIIVGKITNLCFSYDVVFWFCCSGEIRLDSLLPCCDMRQSWPGSWVFLE